MLSCILMLYATIFRIFHLLINFSLQLQTTYNLLQYEVLFTVFPLIVKNAMANSIIHHLWHINTNLVLRGFIDTHLTDLDSMARILDICQEQKVCELVINLPFCVCCIFMKLIIPKAK